MGKLNDDIAFWHWARARQAKSGVSWSSYWKTHIMPDGHTVAWYDAGDGSSIYLTKDGSDLVAQWNDLSGNARHLLQSTPTNKPKWTSDGVLFDGVDNFLRTANFTFNQPIEVFLVMKQITWFNYENFLSTTTTNVAFYQHGTSPQVYLFAGAGEVCLNADLTLDTFAIVRILFNGASSKIRIGTNDPVIGNPGTNGFGNIQIGSDFTTSKFAHFKLREAIFRNIADSADNEKVIYNYLAEKYGFFLT